MLRTVENDDKNELLDIQKRSTMKMLDMINNFMIAVRSYQREEHQIISLNDLVKSSVEVIRGNQILKHRVSIELDLRTPDTIKGAPMEVMQIIDNIATNAAESMMNTDRYHMTITTEKSEGYIRLSVKDEGVGIEVCADCDEKKCLRCKRFSIGKSTKEKGVGIGLVYVREILQEMNGRMYVESEVDSGSTFHILFPCSPVESKGGILPAARA